MDSVLIDVVDNGPGVEKKKKEFIFDPFFTTKDHGTGLGLSIVYQIINNHQGSIEILDNSESGAIFRITLPKLVKARYKKVKND